MLWNDIPDARLMECCPYGQPGDIMVATEVWCRVVDEDRPDGTPNIIYRSHSCNSSSSLTGVDCDGTERHIPRPKCWRSARLMPTSYSRIRRPIVRISVERIQEITAEEVQCEGVRIPVDADDGIPLVEVPNPYGLSTPEHPWTDEDYWRCAGACAWESIHGPGAWARNDWVWRIEFGGKS